MADHGLPNTMRGINVDHHQAVASRAAEKYVLGELPAAEREEFEEHFFHCADCAQDVRDLSSLAASTKGLLNRPAGSEITGQSAGAGMDGGRPSWLRSSAGFALTAALLAVTIFSGYQTIQLRRLNRPQTPISFRLRPETAIPVQPGGPFVLLEAELPGSAGALRWELRREGSNYVIAQETAEAPDAGAWFRVLAPSSLFAAGDYTLTVRSVSAPDQTWVLRFRIVPGPR